MLIRKLKKNITISIDLTDFNFVNSEFYYL